MGRSTRNVEHMLARRDFGGLQQRPDERRRRMREAHRSFQQRVATRMLEGADCFGFKADYEASYRRRAKPTRLTRSGTAPNAGITRTLKLHGLSLRSNKPAKRHLGWPVIK